MPTALISVYSKEGIVDFALGLLSLGWDLLSSGGTAKTLREGGIPVRDVADLSGRGPILGHRVVTLTPEVHGGLLATDDMMEELTKLGFPRIDLVCVDLYPLKGEVMKAEATRESVIDKTDIGGPTMLRSAAKGRRIVICDPADRARVLVWLKEGKPDQDNFMTKLCAKAEGIIADYCLTSARYHSGGVIDGMVGTEALKLRYGENPNFAASSFTPVDGHHSLATSRFKLEGGSSPSFINVTDLIRSRRTLIQIVAGWQENFKETPKVAIAVKHGNACGVGVSTSDPIQAVQRMIDGDRTSIFGAVVMLNFPVTAEIATALRTYGMEKGKRLLDGVISTSFDEGAADVLERKEGKCRMLSNPALADISRKDIPHILYRSDDMGGFLRQSGDPFVLSLNDPEMEKTKEIETPHQEDLLLAWAIGSTSVSNTITLTWNQRLIGNGVGQQSRVRAARLALMIAEECGHNPQMSVAYSDSFFPEPDGPLVLAKAGIIAVFASSGSVKDPIVREACMETRMALWRLPDKRCRGFYHH